MTTVLKIKITSPDGSLKEHAFNKSQVDVAKHPLVTIAPNEIADIDIEKWPYSPVEVAKHVSLLPGEVDLETEIHRPTRDQIEATFEFCGTDGWDYNGLETIDFWQRFVWVHGPTFEGWLWALGLPKNTCASVLVTDEGIPGAIEIARYRWYSESGGPVSWDGANSLFELGNNLYAAVASGDIQEDAFIFKATNTEESKLKVVADFCLKDNQITDVAFCLEERYETPLARENQAEVSSVVSGIREFGGIWFDEKVEGLQQLRDSLARRSKQYRYIRDFFDDPMNPKFSALWEAMQETVESGIGGELTSDGASWYWNLRQLEKEGKYE